MDSIVSDIVVLLLLIVANGLFALAEVGIVASRKARLQQRQQEGDYKATIALELAESPNRFLSTVQIGITLIGIFAGAFGGATLAEKLTPLLASLPFLSSHAASVSLGLVVLLITYLSLIIGELVPKRIGLHSPERIATMVALPMRWLSQLAGPIVTVLSISTDAILHLFGLRESEDPPVTEEEIKVMIDKGTAAGVFADVERTMVGRIFRFGDRTVSSLMTRRPDIVWLDLEDSLEENLHKVLASVYSRLPICRGGLDHVIGIVRAKDLLNQHLSGQGFDLEAALHPAVVVHEALPAVQLLETLRTARTHIVLVIDEHGSIQGLVTLNDILGAIIGDLPSVDESDEPYAVQREDGSWLLDGLLPPEELKEIFQLSALPGEESGTYETLSGFVMMQMGRVPTVADHFQALGLRFEVVDMDGHRIDKILVTPLPPMEEDEEPITTGE